MNLYRTLTQPEPVDDLTTAARRLREQDAGFAVWAAGGGIIRHSDKTQGQVAALAAEPPAAGHIADVGECYRTRSALDCLKNQARWLVVHMTYAKNVYLDGRDMKPDDFKRDPPGHTGGSLNMVPAYAGMLA